MPTLIVSESVSNGSWQLVDSARGAGWNVVCLDGKEVPTSLQGEDAVYYGATDVALKVAKQLDMALLEPPFDWLARLPEAYLLRKVCYATVAEARLLTGSAFVKPADATRKCFDSGVYPGGWAIPERRGFPDTTAVLIAEPVDLEVEYRCFVLEGTVATFAAYSRAGRWMRTRDEKWPIPEAEADRVIRFCRTLASDPEVESPPAFTLDVGRIAGRGWAVVEANPAWSSGFYGCETAKILPVLRRACVRRQSLTIEDRRWSIVREPKS